VTPKKPEDRERKQRFGYGSEREWKVSGNSRRAAVEKTMEKTGEETKCQFCYLGNITDIYDARDDLSHE